MKPTDIDILRDPTEPGINLDGFGDADNLWSFAECVRTNPRACARILFPDRPKGYVSETKMLCHYAYNKATAMRCRLDGRIPAALIYERICEDIYGRLAEFARW